MVASHHWPLDQAHENGLEDVHLGDLLRMGTAARKKVHYLPRIFKGPTRGAPDTGRDAVIFTENSVPISTSKRAIPVDTNFLQRKINLPGSSVDVSEFGCVYRMSPEGPISVSGLGESFNPFPFGGIAETNTSMCLRLGRGVGVVRKPVRLRKPDFFRSLRTTEPMFNAVSHGTLASSLQSSKVLTEYLLHHQDLEPVGGSRRLTPGTFNAPPHPPTPPPPRRPSYSLRRKPHEGSSAVAARYRPTAGRPSIVQASLLRSVAFPSNPTPRRDRNPDKKPSSYGPRNPLWQQPGQGDWLRSPSPARSLLKRHISPRPCERGYRRWGFPGSLAVTKGIHVRFLFSALLLLKFRGYLV
ncbi:hypothetical protein JTE90_025236 [Oedothorax gibbosus]|uniref:Uncharacterized protein n=1 Tax=Oedothorax gibbosus TaxID=931172 RepID=A0AAV6THL0_9ARAC|nr:hypothetical protein JTE90_025236 [Oedothorax gibbosus]